MSHELTIYLLLWVDCSWGKKSGDNLVYIQWFAQICWCENGEEGPRASTREWRHGEKAS